MSDGAPYHSNGPTEGTKAETEESADLKAIRRDTEMNRLSQEIWRQVYPDGDSLGRDFEQLADAAQDWTAATPRQRFRALRVLVKRFGKQDAYRLVHIASPTSMQDWRLLIRKRKGSEKPDGGKRDNDFERDWLAQRVGKEVYQRIAAGELKADAIRAVKEDYRTGAPYPQIEGFPVLHRPKLDLPDVDGIEKLLAIFRRNARRRGYIDSHAPYLGSFVAREPKLKLSDIPVRGRPRKKWAARRSAPFRFSGFCVPVARAMP